MADRAQQHGPERGQFADHVFGKDFARAEIAFAAEIEILELIADALQGGNGLEDLNGLGGDFRPVAIAAYHRDAKNVIAAHDVLLSGDYQAKWAKALLASAMRWTFSRLVYAAPSRLYA